MIFTKKCTLRIPFPFNSELGVKPQDVGFICIAGTCITPVSGEILIGTVVLLSSVWKVAFAALNSRFTGVLLYVFNISKVISSAEDTTLTFFPCFNLYDLSL